MKQILGVICLTIVIGYMYGEIHENAGQYGYKFLNVPTNPISLSMAGRGVHSPGNPSAFINQPAAACEANQRILGISHSPWLADTQLNTLAYSYAKRSSHLGIALRNLDYGDVENRDDTGYLIGYYNPLDITLLLNYAYRLGPSTYCGFNVGTLFQKLNTATSLGAYADMGFSFLPPVKGSKVSVAIRNMGNANYTNKEKVRFPVTFEGDITKQFSIGNQMATFGIGGIKVIDEEMKGSISTEVQLLSILKLRAGYKLNYAAENISAGMGVAYHRIGVDYGYAAFDNGLNDVHSFGLSYQF